MFFLFYESHRENLPNSTNLTIKLVMKKFTLFSLFICLSFTVFAQLNCTQESNVTYSINLNDIWGYESAGREYALVGTRTGVNILDVTDPANPVDKGTATGPNSIWRDIKTWGDYAYVTNETGDGLLVIDLSGLPTAITSSDWHYWEPNITDLGGILTDCHNLWVDENGYGYLSGCNLNSGGVIYIDLFSDPLNNGSPVYVGKGPAVYSHDVFVENNIMYSSEVYEGEFTIFDVTNKSATVELGSQTTPDDFTHNAWTNGSGVLFTTDEVANAPVASYDVSDPTDIQLLDEFRPLASINTGQTPHNVHVLNDYLIISHYALGVVIVDASDPENLIEVGNYDTCSGSCSGAWGAYPFLTSGTILVSDMGEGFFAIDPTYVRAARIEGTITDSQTGADLNGVTVEIIDPQDNQTTTGFDGIYKTGIATAGTFDVTYTRSGYHSQTISSTLTSGSALVQDVQMVPINLDIDLLGFEVKKNEEGGAELIWSATSDDLSIQFEIERSIDGSNFETIGTVIDDQPSLITKSYNYIDEEAPYGKLFYRLKMLEPSGESNISPIKSLDHFSAAVNVINVYPNPVSTGGKLTFEVENLRAKSINMEIFNGIGVLVDQVYYEGDWSQEVYTTDKLSKGVYFFKFMDENGRLLHLEKVSVNR